MIFVANQTSGPHAATEANSLDETVVKVVSTPVTRTASGSDETGKVFLIYGVSVGEAEIRVFRDGEDVGTLTVFVVAQDRS